MYKRIMACRWPAPILAQSSSGKLWSEKKTTRGHVLGWRWVDRKYKDYVYRKMLVQEYLKK